MITHKLRNPVLISNINGLLVEVSNFFIHKNVTIDLSNVIDIDSAGIAFLIEIKKIATNKSCNLSLINPTPQIDHLCQLYRVNL